MFAGDFSNMTVCDGKQMILRCEKPLKIVISDAIYGRMPQDTSLCSGRIPTGTFDWFVAGIWGRKMIGWDIQISDRQRRYLIGIIRFTFMMSNYNILLLDIHSSVKKIAFMPLHTKSYCTSNIQKRNIEINFMKVLGFFCICISFLFHVWLYFSWNIIF